MITEHKHDVSKHQTDIQLQNAQKSLNQTFSFKSYLAIFMSSDLECKLSMRMRTCKTYSVNLRSLYVDLEKHLKFTASCNLTLQAMFEIVNLSDYLPLN